MENEQLQFLKTIRPLDADKPESESQPAEEEVSNSTLDDLGFPDDDHSTDGENFGCLHHRHVVIFWCSLKLQCSYMGIFKAVQAK